MNRPRTQSELLAAAATALHNQDLPALWELHELASGWMMTEDESEALLGLLDQMADTLEQLLDETMTDEQEG